MRNLFNFIDKPEFSQHFNWEDPFYDPSPPLYSFIAHAFIPLGPIYRNMPIKTTLSLFSPYTLAPIGTCRLQFRTIGIAPPPRTGILLNSPNGTIQPTVIDNLCPLVDDAKITLEIIIDEVTGLTSRDFSSIHYQFRASSITGVLKDGTEDHVWSSRAFDLPCDQKEMILKQTISVVMTPQTKSYMANGCAPIEFFGQLMPSYLDRLERQDEKRLKIRNQYHARRDQYDQDARIDRTWGLPIDNDHFTECAGSGCVLPETGLQRKLAIRLTHNSGRQFGWQRMEKVEMGNVRLLDGQGRIHSSKVDRWVTIKASKKPVVHFEADGTSWMDYIGNWDAGGHESNYLIELRKVNRGY
ncbi:hypothetical protein H4Q26_005457 [Puccinia striiformis f. sp. tritici PST-130]|nr:hypothetical protein H4Q26_005457 [Puccinia striiformis f. sp. tritici PST-130]